MFSGIGLKVSWKKKKECSQRSERGKTEICGCKMKSWVVFQKGLKFPTKQCTGFTINAGPGWSDYWPGHLFTLWYRLHFYWHLAQICSLRVESWQLQHSLNKMCLLNSHCADTLLMFTPFSLLVVLISPCVNITLVISHCYYCSNSLNEHLKPLSEVWKSQHMPGSLPSTPTCEGHVQKILRDTFMVFPTNFT